MITYNIRVVAKIAFDGCTHFFIDEQGLGHGAMIDRCDKCQSEMICFETGGMGFSYGPLQSLEVNMEELCILIGLKQFDYSVFPGCSNVEDYSDEYQVTCDCCSQEIMEDYYNEDN